LGPSRGLIHRNGIQIMKTYTVLLGILLSVGLATSALAAQGRGQGGSSGSGRSTMRPAPSCDRTGPGQGTPLRDGSGKATAPGKGSKDGSGKGANCPTPPTR